MSGSHTRALALVGALSLALAACTDSEGGGAASPSPTVAPGLERGAVQQPSAPTTVLPGADGALALEASRTFFAEAPVAVLADDADAATHLRASSVALALGAPVLIDADGAALADELARLGTGWVLTVGDATVPDGSADVVVVSAPQDDDALAAMIDRPAEPAVEVGEGGEVAAVVGLERGTLAPLAAAQPVGAADDGSAAEGATGTGDGVEGPETGDGADAGTGDAGDEPTGTGGAGEAVTGDGDDSTPDAGEAASGSDAPADAGDAELPQTELPEPVTGTLVLSTGSRAELLGAATARAAGADVVVAPGGDPRATSETVAAVSEATAEHVVGLGDGVGDTETLGWRAETAATGVELPGGGQLVFPGKRYVALYGSPVTSTLGVLGEQGTEATIARAAEHARAYEGLTDDTVVPALEVIVTVASSSAGSDGNYSNEWPVEDFRELVEAAGEAGQYVVLDLQPGRSSFLEQAQQYADLLELPHVGLALDPEWNLGPEDVHMVRIGSVTADEVNEVVHWLADFTRERNLPQKLLVLHQFQVRMIQTVPEVDLSRSELGVLVHADGQGGQSAKQETWRTLHTHGPDIEWWGWKNFYDEDVPMLTPEQTAQVEPFPHFISYQ